MLNQSPPQSEPQLKKNLLQFFDEPFLSDSLLKHNEIELNIHKVILASASQYVYDFYQLNTSKERKDDKDVIALPPLIQSAYAKADLKSSLLIVLKYCYANQNYEAIQQEVTDASIHTILQLAYSLRIVSLIAHLEKRTVDSIVKWENSVAILKEAIMFELPQLRETCLEMIKKEFGRIQMSPEAIGSLLELNYELFRNLMGSDDLNVKNEKEVCELVLGYIKSRRQLKVEEIPQNIQEGLLNEEKKEEPQPEEKKEEPVLPEEKKEEPQAEEKKEEPPQPEEKKQTAIEEPEKKEDLPPSNDNPEVDLIQKWQEHIDKVKASLNKVPLTKEQERELIECIRFSFLSHSDLIGYTGDAIIKDYQDLLLEGLSVRLNTYESTHQQSEKINLKPRLSYESIPLPSIIPRKSKQIEENSKVQEEEPSIAALQHQGERLPSQPKDKDETVPQFPNNQSIGQGQDDQMNVMYQSIPVKPIKDKVKLIHTQSYMDSSLSQDKISVDNIAKQRKHNDYFAKSHSNPFAPQDPIISLNFYKSQATFDKQRPSFKYDYDFDENGVFFYLGTLGKMNPYRNPQDIGQVKVFASSTGKGSLADFVGRELVNLRTLNEENSFIGVDLGQERFLLPSAYSLKNRNSSSHVMLCWQLEASIDRVSYEVIDRRIFSVAGDAKQHQALEKERNMLKQPGCTSTWNINKKVKEKHPNGFRFFFIRQIAKNSSGGYNLAISGFELYGEGIGRKWLLN